MPDQEAYVRFPADIEGQNWTVNPDWGLFFKASWGEPGDDGSSLSMTIGTADRSSDPEGYEMDRRRVAIFNRHLEQNRVRLGLPRAAMEQACRRPMSGEEANRA